VGLYPKEKLSGNCKWFRCHSPSPPSNLLHLKLLIYLAKKDLKEVKEVVLVFSNNLLYLLGEVRPVCEGAWENPFTPFTSFWAFGFMKLV
jgi:hypothetical protein